MRQLDSAEMFCRPHHGLCIPHFQGRGYSEEFVANMTQVIAELGEHPEKEITLHTGTDILCAHCPHNNGGKCESAQKVARYDKAVLALCGLKEGETLPWKDFQARVHACILSKGKLPEVCVDCQWLSVCTSCEACARYSCGEQT